MLEVLKLNLRVKMKMPKYDDIIIIVKDEKNTSFKIISFTFLLNICI